MANRHYEIANMYVSYFKTAFDNNRATLLFGNAQNSGYPVSEIMQALAYIIADEDELFGKRPKGYYQIIERHIERDPMIAVEVRLPDLLTPMIIAGNGRGTIIGAKNPDVYSRLISRDPLNEYKIIVRPITEDDLRNA